MGSKSGISSIDQGMVLEPEKGVKQQERTWYYTKQHWVKKWVFLGILSCSPFVSHPSNFQLSSSAHGLSLGTSPSNLQVH